MWVNKSVNPSQTSTRAAQAAPPRMTPGTEHAAGCATHTALRADLRRNGPGDLPLPPRAGRGKRCSASAQGELLRRSPPPGSPAMRTPRHAP
jgi:hypothetical protein